MKVTLSVASIFTLILMGLILAPINIDGKNELVLYIGNFHPLILHIPIGALLGVFVLEVVNLIKPKLQLENASKILLWFTVISLIPAVIFGMFLASSGGYNVEVLSFHKWLGWATALLCVWLLVFRLWAYTKSQKTIRIYQGLLFINVILLTFAGHYGGSLTHGAGYLTKDMPVSMKEFFGVEKSKTESILSSIKELAKDKGESEEAKLALIFADSIHPIMDKNCFECHNANKQKGDLRLDTASWEMIKPEDVKKWETVFEEISEGNMPPEEEEPLTEADKNSILNWITNSLNKLTPEVKQQIALKEEAKAKAKAEQRKKELAILASKPKVKLSKQALHYANNIKPIMDKYCYDCHGPDKQKGSVRLDRLNWDMVKGADAESWHSALDMINSGEMPPKKKPQLTAKERKEVVNWITNSLEHAAKAKNSNAKEVTRRLTKSQYTNSLNEILGLPINFGSVLPDDGKSKMGFTNNGETLQISSLHIDYYQKIARNALDKAIVFGDKPEPKIYKITVGEGIGKNEISAEFGGFQSVAIKSDNFKVDVLDSKNNEKTDVDEIKRLIGIGMRGSGNDRFSVVENGLMLYSALPHKDVPPRSWQGPSPNMKMLVKNNFPRSGRFKLKIIAAKGYALEAKEGIIGLRKNEPAVVNANTIIIKAKDVKVINRLQLKDDKFLVPIATDANATAKLKLNVPETGYYQIDLVHPYVPQENMPSFLMKIGRFNKVQERLKLDKSLADKSEIVTPVTLASLKKGTYEITLGGKFFVGFSEVRISQLSDDDPLPKKLKAEAAKNQKKYENMTPSIRAFIGSRTDDGMDYRTFDEDKDVIGGINEFNTYEFTGQLENLPLPVYDPNEKNENSNTMIIGLWNNHLVKQKGETGPPLLVKSMELEAPYHPVWPPESHTNIFFDSPNKNNKEVYTAEVLKKFMEHAFRRPLIEGELDRYMDFWRNSRDDFDRYEDGVKEVLVAVLCSPSFLYLLEGEKPSPKNTAEEFLLASKMSYFLWNTPPDNELINLAKQGDLKKQLPNQIVRMANSPKIKNMIESFAYDWLRVDRLKGMSTNKNLYPDFTRFVKQDMAEETYSFIHYILKENLSILNFIDSDFAMLNQNLAEFYGVEGVKGNAFRPVAIAREKNRGGLLSQGAFLTGHSDGVQAHPIKRAVWLKEKILGDPPPPPPPNVPELDPETPGFETLTLKEQLELHRNKASCVDCHLKIDPFGVAFENYDAVGRYQKLAKNKPIDSKSKLPDGTEVEGIEGIKEYILNLKREDFTKSLVEHLYAYALGRDVSFSDDKELNRIVEKIKKNDYKFQTVLEEIVLSDSFSKSANQ
ncbi:hypothetical protein GCM10022291_24990 [Postechiella marina]|uniref:Cytochrome c domain-containing protein n=1 Tax=Postechiella marina TaxID=943941 RepID=A0ABP8CCK9_9FLAO